MNSWDKTNKPKIAVMLCGEYRTWEQTAPNIFNFFKNVDVEYFFSTWDRSYINEDEYETVSTARIRKTFIRHNLAMCETISCDDSVPDYMRRNTWLMSNMWHRVNHLRRMYEHATHFSYDLVILLRCDLVFSTEDVVDYASLDAKFNNKYFGSFNVSTNGFALPFSNHMGFTQPDWVYGSSGAVMDIICSYRDYLLYGNNVDNLIPNTTHNTLTTFFMERKLIANADYIPLRKCEVFKDGCDVDLSTIGDNELKQIKKYRLEWKKKK